MGQDWFGRRVMPGGVIFLAAERAALVKRRLAAFRLYHGIADLPLKVFSGSIDLRTNRTQAHGIVNYIQRWRDEEGVETKLIIGDTTSKLLFGGDENSPKDMGGFINNVSHIQEGSGAHFLLVHHIPHEQNRMRGHGPTIRAENNAGIRTATIEKNNDGEEGDQITFNLESFDLGSDPETGEVTTAPIVRPTEATSRTTTAEPRLRRLTKNQQTMYSFLHDAGRNGLTTDEWNAIARANDIGTKRKADLVDLRSALKAKGLVREFNDRWTAVTD
jgi:AAA domain